MPFDNLFTGLGKTIANATQGTSKSNGTTSSATVAKNGASKADAASLSELRDLLDSGDNVSLVVAPQGSRVTERGCKDASFDLERAVQIMRDGASAFQLRGLSDSKGDFNVDFSAATLQRAVKSAVDELRNRFADLPRESHKYAVYFPAQECSGPDIFKDKSALERKVDVGTLLGEPKPTADENNESFFDTKPTIGAQLRELYTLHSADADNKLLVTLRANLPAEGPPTCNFDESLQTVQSVTGTASGDSASDLADALLSAAKKVSQSAGGAEADDIVVLFKPAKRCEFFALNSAELDYVEPLKRILTSNESLEKNKIRLGPIADPNELNNVPGNNAKEKQAENERRKQELFTPSGSGGGAASGNAPARGGAGGGAAGGGNNGGQPNDPPKKVDDEEKATGGLSTVAIFGIVGGILLVVVLILVFVVFRGRDSSASEQMPIIPPLGGPPVPFRGPLLQNDQPFGPGLPPPPPPPSARPLPRNPTAGQFF